MPNDIKKIFENTTDCKVPMTTGLFNLQNDLHLGKKTKAQHTG